MSGGIFSTSTMINLSNKIENVKNKSDRKDRMDKPIVMSTDDELEIPCSATYLTIGEEKPADTSTFKLPTTIYSAKIPYCCGPR